MKKLVTLLASALFALVTAVPVNAAPAGENLEIVPAPKAVKVVKVQKHKKAQKAKHKHVRAHKPRR